MLGIVAAFSVLLVAEASASALVFSECRYGARANCVVDGDTFWLGRQKIRVADIDAPEIGGAQCAEERANGLKAKQRLLELLNLGPFELRRWRGKERDRYGRILAVVVRDGASLGDKLVSEGLVRTWDGKRRPWCS
jgi:micrococcal nuclease